MIAALSALTTLALAATSAVAAPIIDKRAATAPGINDTVILQYALTLEHLENTFYHDALGKFDAAAFSAAGFPDWVRNRFEQVASDEASHVAFLTTALGADAVAAGNYTFPYTDPASFAALASVIENVGVSAYLGAAEYISTPEYLTAAGSILTTEARHQAWISSAVDKANPWSSPYDTPLGFDEVYSLVAPFITSMPASNPTLPVMAYPSLTASSSVPGSTSQLAYTDSTTTEKYLLIFYGLSTVAVPINSDKTVTIPAEVLGTAYGVVSSSNNVTVVDATAFVAGPVILLNPFPSATMIMDGAGQ
ncbi:hypothetical protein P7C73_g957, partial [Tremellales sp. Uapishka_1]